MMFSLFLRLFFKKKHFSGILSSKVYLSSYSFLINEEGIQISGDGILDKTINKAINTNNVTYANVSGSFDAIGDEVFNGCPKIVCVILPETIVEIGKDSFVNCPMLNDIRIPNMLRKIGNNSFQNVNISSFFIPKDCVDISEIRVLLQRKISIKQSDINVFGLS